MCVLLSTLGRVPRAQATTRSIAFCRSCLERCQAAAGLSPLGSLSESVNTALKALTRQSEGSSNRDGGEES